MADKKDKAAAKDGAQEKPKNLPPLQIHTQYVKDFSFESPNSPESLTTAWGQPETHVQVNIRTQDAGNDTHEVVLLFRIESRQAETKKTGFILEMAYAALVTLNNVPEEHQKRVLTAEIPKLLFPFAREAIAHATGVGGFPPLLLNPLNFDEIYMRELAKEEQAKKDQGKAKVN